jgi:hypothetical protein
MRTLAFLLGCWSLVTHAQTTRVLFIGNSYTYSNDLPGMFTQLAASMGETVQTGMVAPGGYTFQGHTTYAATQTAIAQGDWDFVVFQEQSQRPAFPPTQVAVEVYPYATQLAQQVRAANPCTEVVYLMTWGRENGDAANCPNYPPLCTYEGMQQRLYESYVEMAAQNNAWCAPAGEVWRMHRNDFPTTGLYTDGSHPNVLGSYIAATTLASTLFRRSCVEATMVPAGITAEQALAVRTMASTVVANTALPWNIGVNDPVADGDWTLTTGTTVQFANNTVGGATQLWDLGDGTTSTDADPLHTYVGPGLYTISLLVTDECGRSDSTEYTLDLVNTGVANTPDARGLHVFANAGYLHLEGGPESGTLTLSDATGRTIGRHELAHEQQQVALPSQYVGPLLWRVQGTDGRVRSGRIMVQ